MYVSAVEDVTVAGRALGVAAVLEGSVRRAGNRLRVTVQLVRAEDGRSLWADKFDEPFTDLFTVEDRIAERATLLHRADTRCTRRRGRRIHLSREGF